jgi:hypothetical protein
MRVTFTITEPGANANMFSIIGNPGDYTHNLITKAQLLAGYEVNFPESVTGGTINVTADSVCIGTFKTWRVNDNLYPLVVYGANTLLNVCARQSGEYITIYQYEGNISGLINGVSYYNIDHSPFSGTYSYYFSGLTCKYGYFENGIFISMGNCESCTDTSEPPAES